MEQARNRAAESRAAPKISVEEPVTRGNNPVFVFGSMLEQAQFGPANFDLPTLNNPASLTNFRTVLSADLSLFDGRKTSARVAQARIGSDVALLQNQAAEQQVRFEVLRNYFGLVLAESALDVAEDALRTDRRVYVFMAISAFAQNRSYEETRNREFMSSMRD